jgi:hypothetical protein
MRSIDEQDASNMIKYKTANQITNNFARSAKEGFVYVLIFFNG